jgi:hypothetical protein
MTGNVSGARLAFVYRKMTRAHALCRLAHSRRRIREGIRLATAYAALTTRLTAVDTVHGVLRVTHTNSICRTRVPEAVAISGKHIMIRGRELGVSELSDQFPCPAVRFTRPSFSAPLYGSGVMPTCGYMHPAHALAFTKLAIQRLCPGTRRLRITETSEKNVVTELKWPRALDMVKLKTHPHHTTSDKTTRAVILQLRPTTGDATHDLNAVFHLRASMSVTVMGTGDAAIWQLRSALRYITHMLPHYELQ